MTEPIVSIQSGARLRINLTAPGPAGLAAAEAEAAAAAASASASTATAQASAASTSAGTATTQALAAATQASAASASASTAASQASAASASASTASAAAASSVVIRNELQGRVNRWGEPNVGQRNIGIPGSAGFGMADPPLDIPQIDAVLARIRLALLNNATATTQLATDNSSRLATTAFVKQQAQQFDGVSIGIPGAQLFGVGAALSGDIPVGITLAAYFPIHPRTRSYM